MSHPLSLVLLTPTSRLLTQACIHPQDQWWLSGIFRDVYLLAFPERHIKDFSVETRLDNNYRDATLNVKVELSASIPVRLKLLDNDQTTVVAESNQFVDIEMEHPTVVFSIPISNPCKWTAETPYLYHLLIEVDGQLILQKVGFRCVEIKDGLFMVNGKRVLFKGVNRHEHHPKSGRTVPFEFLKHDILLMKKHNINAIRTSHQPNDIRLYDLADELGFYVMNEADLECHGFAAIDEATLPQEQKNLSFDERKTLIYEGAARWTSDNGRWREAYVDRARQLVARDRNHACVVMWSLGNEAFYGCNFKSMSISTVVNRELDADV